MTFLDDCLGLIAVLLSVGLVAWLATGRLLLPGSCPVRALVEGRGCGEGLEHTVRGLLWLRKAGLWRGTVVIQNCGLDDRGILLAQLLARRNGVEFNDMG